MKEYDKIRSLPLAEVFNTYIEINGLTVAYAARCMGISYTSLAEWTKGMRPISRRNASKVREFLKGSFLISSNRVITYILMQKEQETEKNASGTD